MTLNDKWLESLTNSVGSKDFRRYYVRQKDRWTDLLEDGELSCTAFITRKLAEFSGLIATPHAMGKSAIIDLKKFRWHEIKEVRPGAIIFWEDRYTRARPWNPSGKFPHIGVYLGNDKAISHSDKEKSPVIHHYTFGTTKEGDPVRKINLILWHEALNESVL